MVPNITSGSSFYGVIAYNKIKVDDGTAKVLWHPKIAADTSGNVPIENCVQAFEPYIALNSHVRKPVIHISLNPSPKDILSEEQMTVLAQEFMEKVRLREPALYRMVARRHKPQTHAHRFGTYQRAGWKDRPQSGGYPGTEHLPWNGSEVRASSHIRRTRWEGTIIPTKSGLSERRREITGKAYRPNLAGMLQLSLACRIQHSSEPV